MPRRRRKGTKSGAKNGPSWGPKWTSLGPRFGSETGTRLGTDSGRHLGRLGGLLEASWGAWPRGAVSEASGEALEQFPGTPKKAWFLRPEADFCWQAWVKTHISCLDAPAGGLRPF